MLRENHHRESYGYDGRLSLFDILGHSVKSCSVRLNGLSGLEGGRGQWMRPAPTPLQKKNKCLE